MAIRIKTPVNNIKERSTYQHKVGNQKEDTVFDVTHLLTAHKNFKITNINFQLKPGEILGLVGKSGSGKSTVLETIVGLKKPKKGRIRLILNNKNQDIRKAIGFSHQDNALFPLLSVKENLKIFSKLHNIKKKEAEQKIAAILNRLDLTGSETKKFAQLSGGMKKRADLAATLIHSPSLLILDEPFSGLDITMRKFLWQILKELASEGKMIIVTSHLLTDLEKNCTSFALVHQNRFFNQTELENEIKKSGLISLKKYLECIFEKECRGFAKR